MINFSDMRLKPTKCTCKGKQFLRTFTPNLAADGTLELLFLSVPCLCNEYLEEISLFLGTREL